MIIREMSKEPDKVWDIADVGVMIYGEKIRPRFWPNVVAVTMRNLALKTRFAPVRITRSSSLGRGQKASYRIEFFKVE
jgi:hypothetical protein